MTIFNARRKISYTNHTFHTFEVIKKKKKDGKFAWTVKVGEKGQIVIPKEARDVFGIVPGDTLILFGDPERGIAIPPKQYVSCYVDKVFNNDNENS